MEDKAGPLDKAKLLFKTLVDKALATEKAFKHHLQGAQNVKDLDQRMFECAICSQLLHNPVADNKCGKFFCKECIDRWRPGKAQKDCPNCNEVMETRQLSLCERNHFKEMMLTGCGREGCVKSD